MAGWEMLLSLPNDVVLLSMLMLKADLAFILRCLTILQGCMAADGYR